jgi:hypothetical protein
MRHPELKDGEVLLGNVKPAAVRHLGWKTMRFGETAYGKDGNPVNGESKPLFVTRDEATANGNEIDADGNIVW